MSIVFSTITFFGFIVTVAAGVAWIVGKLRHRETKARVVCIAAALVTVVAFVAFGVTHEPTEKAEEPPAAESTEPAQSDAQAATGQPSETEPTVTTPAPEGTPQATTEPTEEATLPEVTEPPAASTQPPAEETEPAEEVDPVEQDKQDIEEAARQIIADHYTNTDIEAISVNENLGTEADGDYILLVYVTWNVKNSARMTKQVLAMYSEDFAARVGSEIENVQEVAIFWTVPYHIENRTAIKYSYARACAGMYQTDCVIMIQE